MRRAALRAWAEVDGHERISRAFRARHRPPATFYEGQLVYVWRQPKVGAGRWDGPGILVLPTAGGAWINMRGALWRVSNEQMRPATAAESKEVEVVNQFLDSMRTDFQRTCGPKKFLDVTREGDPSFREQDDGGQSSDEEHDDARTIETRAESRL